MNKYEITQPTPDDLRTLFNQSELSRADIAALLHVSRKGLEKWTAPIGSASHRDVPLAAYELLLIKLDQHPTYGKLPVNT